MIVIWIAITLLCVLILVWSMPRCIVAMWLPMLVCGHAMCVVAMLVCWCVWLYYVYASMLVRCRSMCVPCIMCSWSMLLVLGLLGLVRSGILMTCMLVARLDNCAYDCITDIKSYVLILICI